MKLWNRVKKAFVTDVRGEGMIDQSWPWNFWQQNSKPLESGLNPDLEAAVALYARALSAVPIQHVEHTGNGGVRTLHGTAVDNVLRRPNEYLSTANLVSMIVRALLIKGSAPIYVEKDGRGTVGALHPLVSADPYVAETGDVFFGVQLNEAHKGVDLSSMIPARHMANIRYQPDSRNPLRGSPPLAAHKATLELGAVVRASQANFHSRAARPSGTLQTDQKLTKQDAQMLRERWEEHENGYNAGKTAILSHGMKWEPMSFSAQDSQVVEMLRMTTEDIARLYGIPGPLMLLNNGTTFSNLGLLMGMWRSTGLLSLAVIIESELEHALRLPRGQEIRFRLDALERANTLEQSQSLKELAQNAIITPDEARERLELDRIGGTAAQLVAQQQIVPLELTADSIRARMDREDARLRLDEEQARKEPDAPAQPAQPDDAAPKDDIDPVKLLQEMEASLWKE